MKKILTTIKRKFGSEKSLMTSYMKYKGQLPMMFHNMYSKIGERQKKVYSEEAVQAMLTTTWSLAVRTVLEDTHQNLENGEKLLMEAIAQHKANLKEFGFPIRQDKTV